MIFGYCRNCNEALTNTNDINYVRISITKPYRLIDNRTDNNYIPYDSTFLYCDKCVNEVIKPALMPYILGRNEKHND